jgi:4-hydroxy-3-polyprenylbenzoate decarboxylase
MAQTDLVVAFTGASGSVYGLRLLEVLLTSGRTVHFCFSPAAAEVLRQESGRSIEADNFRPTDLFGDLAGEIDLSHLHYHHYRDFSAGIASGSFLTGGMVICPCSMGTVGAIAHGLSDNLLHRAADVHLKERRKLVLVPRETPLGIVQLKNLTACAEAGAVVLPASPGFYHRPTEITQLVDFVVGRICDQLSVEHRLFERWGAGPSA